MTNKFKHYFLPLFSVLSLAAGYAQTDVPRNQDVLSQLLIPSTIAILTDSLQIDSGVVINSERNAVFENWIVQILTDSCLSKNFLVYSDADSSKMKHKIMVSSPFSEIAYRSAGRKWLFFKKGLHRDVQGGYRLQVENPGGRLIYSGNITGQYSDVMLSGAQKNVENPDLGFTKGTKSSSSFIKRWLEPVIITAATATVVYLFYTLRSES